MQLLRRTPMTESLTENPHGEPYRTGIEAPTGLEAASTAAPSHQAGHLSESQITRAANVGSRHHPHPTIPLLSGGQSR